MYIVYCVWGSDSQGPWAYVGKAGSPARANASLAERGGDRVEIVATGLTEPGAFACETAVILALEAAGVRLKNRCAGHGAGRLRPQLVGLAAPTGPYDVTRPTIMVGVKFIHGSPVGPSGLQAEAEKFWALDAEVAAAVAQFAGPGGPGVDLVVVPIGAPTPIVIAAWPIVGYQHSTQKFALGPAHAIRSGLVAPVGPQVGQRYLAPSGNGRRQFLACRRPVAVAA